MKRIKQKNKTGLLGQSRKGKGWAPEVEAFTQQISVAASQGRQ